VRNWTIAPRILDFILEYYRLVACERAFFYYLIQYYAEKLRSLGWNQLDVACRFT